LRGGQISFAEAPFISKHPIQISNSHEHFKRDSAIPRRDAPELCMNLSPK
jgi:hypothetical protein